jgi:hypothetical protein
MSVEGAAVAPRRGDRWSVVEELVDEFYRRLVSELKSSEGELRARRSNVFYEALVGRRVAQQSRLERLAVTLLGEYAPRFFRVFFEKTVTLPPPFDFYGVLDDREYWVKVVSGSNALNSAERELVRRESEKYGNPVILTLQGEYFKPRIIGKATWYPPQLSWKLVAGEGAYRAFIDTVYKVAGKYRDEVWKLLQG